MLGVDSELVVRGMNVTSIEADRMGFVFQFPELDMALAALSSRR
jgi:NAD dependent epimerase/dehydratase family enzyme